MLWIHPCDRQPQPSQNRVPSDAHCFRINKSTECRGTCGSPPTGSTSRRRSSMSSTIQIQAPRALPEPARRGRRSSRQRPPVDRQILAFDPVRSSLVELNGNLSTATSVAVLVPGLNTTIEGSAANTRTARRFVSATRGDVATITYLGGPFPGGNPVTGLVDAASPRYALDMAPRLVAFSEDVDRITPGRSRSPTSATPTAVRSWAPPRQWAWPPTARCTWRRPAPESASTIPATGTTATRMCCGFQ